VAGLAGEPDRGASRSLETFIRSEDAERFVEEVRGNDPELAANLNIAERELEAGRTSAERRRPAGAGLRRQRCSPSL
jgi:hypothetical protein